MSEIQEKVAEINRLKATMPVADAAKKVGWSYSKFYYHQTALKKTAVVPVRGYRKSVKPEIIRVEADEDSHGDEVTVIVMKGKGSTIEKISQALGGVL